ncbi:MAG TPA: hemerythrin domain-containing protein [Acidobacteriota bacterium]|nr:hemerythrin domain-containing protein [Acidobacteriota bacterium]
MNAVSICKYFEKDHDRLDGLFQEYQRLKGTDFPRAKECFMQFEFGLRRHIIWEEEILFPIFEEKSGMRENGPTEVMRSEHRQIHQTIEVLRQKLLAGNSNTGHEEEYLLMLLGNHNLKEENILYPLIDDHINEKELQEVFQQMENIPDTRYQVDYTPV